MANRELAAHVANLLNEALALDPKAIESLLNNRVPCNEQLASHETIQCGRRDGAATVGMLGILNGICGVDPDGWGALAVITNDHTKEIIRFEVFPPKRRVG